jgi:predicted TIM-barrel fold metal-dependent hydrolase
MPSEASASVRTYEVISADGHLEIPPDGWMRHVPEEHRGRAPRLVPLAGGGEGWLVEGMPLIHTGQNVSAGRALRVKGQSYWLADGTPAPGTGGPAQRLQEQDADGVDAELLYPPVFVSKFIENISDVDAYLAMVRAYNTFLAEDYCSLAPDRLIGNAVIPSSGVDDAIAELKRVRDLGLRSVALSRFPSGGGTPGPDDDRFWAAALESGLAITAHATFGDRANPLLIASATGNFDIVTAMVSRTLPPPTAMLAHCVASGLFTRFPALQIYLAETNAGWMPEVFYMMDDSYQLFREWYGVTLPALPSEIIREHFWFGIIRDPLAIELRDHLPVDRLMWGSDLPHSVTSYPDTRAWIERIFASAPPALRRQILVDTPCAFFGLDPSAEPTPTPS